MSKRGLGRAQVHESAWKPPSYPHPLASCMMPVVAVLAMMFLGMLALTLWQKSMPGNVTVPAVIGLPVAQAQDRLQQAGLDYEVQKESQPSETVPEGAVLSISPTEGRSVKAGRTIKILLSAGSAYVTVPVVHSQPKDAVHALLAKVELSVSSEDYANNASIPTDCVIDVTPKSGSRVARNSSVKLIISKGPQIDASTGDSQQLHTDTLTVDVPTDASAAAELRIEVTDDNGTRVVYRQTHEPGDVFVFTVEGHGQSTADLYFGDNNFLSQKF